MKQARLNERATDVSSVQGSPMVATENGINIVVTLPGAGEQAQPHEQAHVQPPAQAHEAQAHETQMQAQEQEHGDPLLSDLRERTPPPPPSPEQVA
jgi:hypothetical protein